jgi:hypothetical protein
LEKGSSSVDAIKAIEKKKKELAALLAKAEKAESKAKSKDEKLMVMQIIIDYNHHIQACDTVIELLKKDEPTD